jgi:glutathione synthase/RimK-type ligase-like ATP-grasp enzyme
MRPIAILYENEAWMAPLFGALDSVGAPYERIFANELSFDPAGPAPDWSLAVNKVSPSSYLRGHARSIAVARELLPLLEERGTPVVNGSRAFALETSKARQLLLLGQLGIRAPSARLITDPAQAPSAARELRFPVIVKPNIGGSGAHMRRFDSTEELAAGAADLDHGPEGTGLVQQ